MARGTTAESEIVTVEEQEALEPYAEKPLTAHMEDFVTFIKAGLPDVDIDERSLMLGATCGPIFQRSAFNKSQWAARREARAAGNGAAEAEDEAPAPKRGRGGAKASAQSQEQAAKPTTRRRGRAAAATEDEAPKPTTRRRGRAPKSEGDAPF